MYLTHYTHSQIIGERKEFSIKGTSFEVVYIPSGKFIMGSPESEKDRRDNETQHEVILTESFWMMETEVTQELYEAVTGINPSIIKGKKHPVENISWHDAYDFCVKLSAITRLKWELPTEAEWEYACRAGSQRALFFEDKYNSHSNLITQGFSEYICNVIVLPIHDMPGRYYISYRESHCEVGENLPNYWGLYDMHGNVWEWCFDWYGEHILLSAINPKGPPDGTDRVLKGGSWRSNYYDLRAARRIYFSPNLRSVFFGFRAVMR